MKKWMLILLAALLLTGCGTGPEIRGDGILEEAQICLNPADLRPEGPWTPGENRVIFGQYGGEPITWRILPPSDTQKPAEDGLLLDCETSLCLKAFDGDFRRNPGQEKSPNQWKGSDLELWLNGEFLETAFTREEGAAIALTALRGEGTPYSASDWAFKFTDFAAEDRVFLLSALEAKSLYGSNEARAKSGVSPNWWLRSKFDTGGNGAASIHIDGHICSNSIQNFGVGVSPALNLRISDILFAEEVRPETWKLTLKDPGLTVREKKTAKRRGNGEISVFYLTEGEKIDHISVILTDRDSTRVLYAGTLRPEKSGVGAFTLPEPLREKVCGRDYRAYLLPVQTGEERETDYAGSPVEILIP